MPYTSILLWSYVAMSLWDYNSWPEQLLLLFFISFFSPLCSDGTLKYLKSVLMKLTTDVDLTVIRFMLSSGP